MMSSTSRKSARRDVLATVGLVFIPLSEIVIAFTFKFNSGAAEAAPNLPYSEGFNLFVVNEKELSLCGRNAVAWTIDNRQFKHNRSQKERPYTESEHLVLCLTQLPVAYTCVSDRAIQF